MMRKEKRMITIITEEELSNTPNLVMGKWDFLIEEIPYLLIEHNGETFVLKDNTLWETYDI